MHLSFTHLEHAAPASNAGALGLGLWELAEDGAIVGASKALP